jgi:UDP-N-acetylmuramate--alanine ligase
VQDVNKLRSDITALSFGETAVADLQILSYQSQPGLTLATLKHQNQSYELKLRIPGKFNIRNAAAAILVCHELGIEIDLSCSLLANFRSTQRRSEFIGEKNGVLYYDDYAHHPSEVQQVLSAFRDWFPDRRLIVAFQSHTLSRTKSLFDQFSSAFSAADEVAMIDIFTSARESDDGSVTSEQLCAAIEKKSPKLIAKNYQTLDRLADHLASVTKTGDVVLTVGAGDIYKVHELIK